MTELPVPVVYLSRTERQIIGEITRTGAAGTLISRRLGMSINTYKTHLRRIHEKIDRVLEHEHSTPALIILLLKGQLRVRTCSSSALHNRGAPPPENHICRSA